MNLKGKEKKVKEENGRGEGDPPPLGPLYLFLTTQISKFQTLPRSALFGGEQ